MAKTKTSCIVIGYHQTPYSVHLTMACLANIRKYTAGDYELILIEDIPKFKVRDDYGALALDKHIILDEYTNYTKKMNLAAAEASGEYIVFIQNDCFVWEGWLPVVEYYFDKGMSRCLIPDQLPRTRGYMLDSYAMTMEEGLNHPLAHAEDCMVAITKEAFKKIGGWNEYLRALVMRDFYERCLRAKVNVDKTNKIQVTHITLGTHYQDMDEFDKKLHHDSQILNHGVPPDDVKE